MSSNNTMSPSRRKLMQGATAALMTAVAGRALAQSDAADAAGTAGEPDAREVVQIIRSAGRKAVALPGDIRSESSCQSLVNNAVQQLGGLDILVNNAGRQQSHDSIHEAQE